jgi:3-oxoacyl-[acyl-carrier protein] reductase
MIDPLLEGKVVLVTGANNPYGIGAATAKAFAEQGSSVMLHFLRRQDAFPNDGQADEPGIAFYFEQQKKPADETVQAIRSEGGRAESWEGDLADPMTIPKLFDVTEQALGPVDVLVNNAAYDWGDTFLPEGSLTERDRAGEGNVPITTTAELHDRHFAVNSRAVSLMMTEFARRHAERGATWGRIVNLSTQASDRFPSQISYGASKHALEAFSRSAAHELARFGITVNVIAPGAIQTGSYNRAIVESAVRRAPLGRIGEPRDIADVIVLLASEQARWVTGQTLYVGGGEKMST